MSQDHISASTSIRRAAPVPPRSVTSRSFREWSGAAKCSRRRAIGLRDWCERLWIRSLNKPAGQQGWFFLLGDRGFSRIGQGPQLGSHMLAQLLASPEFPANVAVVYRSDAPVEAALTRLGGGSSDGARVLRRKADADILAPSSETDSAQEIARLLENTSPILIGWDLSQDSVVADLLRKRLAVGRLAQPLYWVCHSEYETQDQPEWLLNHPDVFFVTTASTTFWRCDAEYERYLAGTLEPEMTFDALLAAFALPVPGLGIHEGRLIVDASLISAPRPSPRKKSAPPRKFRPELDAIQQALRDEDFERALHLAQDLTPAMLDPESRCAAAILCLQAASMAPDLVSSTRACDLALLVLSGVRSSSQAQKLRRIAQSRSASLHGQMEDWRAEASIYQEMLADALADPTAESKHTAAWALMRQASLGWQWDDASHASHALALLEKSFHDCTEAPVLQIRAAAKLLEAQMLGRRRHYRQEMLACRALIEEFGNIPDLSVQFYVGRALLRLVSLYESFRDPLAAMKVEAEIARRYREAPFSCLRLLAAESAVHAATRLASSGQPEAATATLEDIANRFVGESCANVREQAAWAQCYRAEILSNTGDLAGAQQALAWLRQHYGSSPDPVFSTPLGRAERLATEVSDLTGHGMPMGETEFLPA